MSAGGEWSSTREDLVRIARDWMAAGWQHPEMAVFESLHASSFHDHSAAGRPPDLEGFLQGIAALYAAFPDFYAEIEDLVVDTDMGKVALRWKATGKHEREFLGAPATGKRISFMGIEILHMENGLIVERWGEWDGLHLLDQIGHTT